MDKWELMRTRHSVRRYKNIPIEGEKLDALFCAPLQKHPH